VALTGAAATPSRVLAEIADATDIIFNAHGLVDSGQSDATLLALTPDSEGRYTLGVADLREAKLRGSPLVILAACRAGELVVSSPHEPISLPTAFLQAGARAVIASSAPIPDAEAEAFFEGVRDRATQGSPLALALHDERQAYLAKDASSWVRSVMLFE
jgi:CHAT domain-containing protein